jgi:acetyl-CoA carboxylase biotin carboxyl carrier protein
MFWQLLEISKNMKTHELEQPGSTVFNDPHKNKDPIIFRRESDVSVLGEPALRPASAICARTQSQQIFIDLRKVRTLVDLVTKLDIGELEVTEGERKVRILKSPASMKKQAMLMQMPTTSAQKNISPIALNVVAPINPQDAAEQEEWIIKSPMVGIFYRSADASLDPYVEAGAIIRKGDKLCMIKAMQIINEIDADISGVIKRILVEDGQPVEFGQPLFAIGQADDGAGSS